METSGKKAGSGGGGATTPAVMPSTPTEGTNAAAASPGGVHCFEIRTANVDYYVGKLINKELVTRLCLSHFKCMKIIFEVHNSSIDGFRSSETKKMFSQGK